MIIFKSIITKNLTNKNIHDICTLKETHWKFGLNSQLNFFKPLSFWHGLCRLLAVSIFLMSEKGTKKWLSVMNASE